MSGWETSFNLTIVWLEYSSSCNPRTFSVKAFRFFQLLTLVFAACCYAEEPELNPLVTTQAMVFALPREKAAAFVAGHDLNGYPATGLDALMRLAQRDEARIVADLSVTSISGAGLSRTRDTELRAEAVVDEKGGAFENVKLVYKGMEIYSAFDADNGGMKYIGTFEDGENNEGTAYFVFVRARVSRRAHFLYPAQFPGYPPKDYVRYFISQHDDPEIMFDTNPRLLAITVMKRDVTGVEYTVMDYGYYWGVTDLYNWAVQGGGGKQLSKSTLAGLRAALGKLPALHVQPPFDRLVMVSFMSGRKWVTYSYDSDELPEEMDTIYDLLGTQEKRSADNGHYRYAVTVSLDKGRLEAAAAQKMVPMQVTIKNTTGAEAAFFTNPGGIRIYYKDGAGRKQRIFPSRHHPAPPEPAIRTVLKPGESTVVKVDIPKEVLKDPVAGFVFSVWMAGKGPKSPGCEIFSAEDDLVFPELKR